MMAPTLSWINTYHNNTGLEYLDTGNGRKDRIIFVFTDRLTPVSGEALSEDSLGIALILVIGAKNL